MSKISDKFEKLQDKIEVIRNISICAHIDHGKTTFSDNLMAGSGLMSKDLAGKVCALDFKDDEQARGITIDSAAVTMFFQVKETEYLVNLIDTPGHVDFGGDVTRALRAVDGTIVLVCAVEGVMPQTETVLRQAIAQGVKPILFINKVDRLITELKLSSDQIQKKLQKIITDFNNLLSRYEAEDYYVSVKDSSVSFGSSVDNWALNFDFINEKNITFKEIVDDYLNNNKSLLKEKAPLYEVIISSVIKHLPNPKHAQSQKLDKLWNGKSDSLLGKAIKEADPKGPLAMFVIKVFSDKQGETAITRIYSGTLKKNALLHLNKEDVNEKLQQTILLNGQKKEQLTINVNAGNIIGLIGLKDVLPGETISETPIMPFKEIKHLFDPVITKSLETKKPSDLPKLEEALKKLPREDPSIKVEINKETGEYLISGNGELHLEIIENRLRDVKGIDVVSGEPIVLYKETVSATGTNDNEELWIKASPTNKDEFEILKNKKSVVVKNNNLLLNSFTEATNKRDAAKLEKTNSLIKKVFESLMTYGSLAGEQCSFIKLEVLGLSLEKEIGYANVLAAMKQAINAARPKLLEPKQTMLLELPPQYISEVNKIISNRKGKIIDMQQDSYLAKIKISIAVENTFGLATDLRSATAGKGSNFILEQEFKELSAGQETIKLSAIRKRKGYRF